MNVCFCIISLLNDFLQLYLPITVGQKCYCVHVPPCSNNVITMSLCPHDSEPKAASFYAEVTKTTRKACVDVLHRSTRSNSPNTP